MITESAISVYETKWNKMYESLVAYKASNGVFNIASKDKKSNGDLISWILNVNREYKQNILSKEKIDRLLNIGFVFKT